MISGASGAIGHALMTALSAQGTEVRRLVRRTPGSTNEFQWNPGQAQLDPAALAGCRAVVNLSGSPIVGRWNEAKKRLILQSRLETTALLARTMAEMETPPEVWICASAVGAYGDTGDTLTDESAPFAQDFLADVCRQWEAATEPARAAGIRVVNLRIGIVLSPDGGALEEMRLPFKAGVGGVVGPGTQYMSWVAVEDVVGAILHAIETPSLSGPVNAVSPNAVTNREFTKTLGRVWNRPTIIPVPGFGLRLLFGEAADAMLMASIRVTPKALMESGYQFKYPDLADAIRAQG